VSDHVEERGWHWARIAIIVAAAVLVAALGFGVWLTVSIVHLSDSVDRRSVVIEALEAFAEVEQCTTLVEGLHDNQELRFEEGLLNLLLVFGQPDTPERRVEFLAQLAKFDQARPDPQAIADEVHARFGDGFGENPAAPCPGVRLPQQP
jgi:hypothetical protein